MDSPTLVHIALGALLVFSLRMADVSIGTVRVLYTIRGQRGIAACIGFFESSIFIFAITRVMKDPDTAKMIGYAAGFAAGTALGITVEQWIASGHFMGRIISTDKSERLRDALREAGFGVTTLPGHGVEKAMDILFIVAARRRTTTFLQLIEKIDPDAFVTLDRVTRAMGGYFPHVAPAASMRK
jgi:uncharacterized protein YebE (UPF0316 family)